MWHVQTVASWEANWVHNREANRKMMENSEVPALQKRSGKSDFITRATG